jgi:hypothetical protein
MPNYEPSTRQTLMDLRLGMRVDRSAALVLQATTNLFTVVGGRVLLTGLLGEVAVIIANTATTLQISHLRTDVTTPVATVLSAASASIAQATAGTMFTLPAAVATALVTSTNNSAIYMGLSVPWVLTVGALSLVGSAAPATGTIKWSAWYIPLDDGAYMATA